MTMTKEQYNILAAELERRGYRKYNNRHSNEADYRWFKSPIPCKNECEDPPYQIEFSVWEYTNYKRLMNVDDCPDYMLNVAILVSTDKIDRIDMEISYKNQSIDEIEKMAASFYEWCENTLEK